MASDENIDQRDLTQLGIHGARIGAVESVVWPSAEGSEDPLESALADEAEVQLRVISRSPLLLSIAVVGTEVRVAPTDAQQSERDGEYVVRVDGTVAIVTPDNFGLAVRAIKETLVVVQIWPDALPASPAVPPLTPPLTAWRRLVAHDVWLRDHLRAELREEFRSDWSRCVTAGLCARAMADSREEVQPAPQEWVDSLSASRIDRLAGMGLFHLQTLQEDLDRLEAGEPLLEGETVGGREWQADLRELCRSRDDLAVVSSLLSASAKHGAAAEALVDALGEFDTRAGPFKATQPLGVFGFDQRLRHVSRLVPTVWWGYAAIQVAGKAAAACVIGELTHFTSRAGIAAAGEETVDLIEDLPGNPPLKLEDQSDGKGHGYLKITIVSPSSSHSNVSIVLVTADGESERASGKISNGIARVNVEGCARPLPGEWYEVRLS